MISRDAPGLWRNRKPGQPLLAFSLVEVVIALGIFSFVLVAILGLFSSGLKSNLESGEQIQAANLASMLISMRTASPTQDIANMPSFAIPTSAMTNAYGPAYSQGSATTYVGMDGQTTNLASASYCITCQAGTNNSTGANMAQLYLMLSWPPQLNPTNLSAGRYEVTTYILLK